MIENLLAQTDELGPEKILWVHNVNADMKGVLVIDCTLMGPAKGGINMVPTVDIKDLIRMARSMTLKCALYDVPFGGGKAAIIADPKMVSKERKIDLVKAFAEAVKPLSPSEYVAGPGLNISDEELAVYAFTNGSLKSCTGKPPEMKVRPGEECNIPPEHLATSYGVFNAIKSAAEHLDLSIDEASVIVEGFGKVGSSLASYLSQSGANLIAVSDSKGVIYNPKGLDVDRLKRVKMETGSVINYEPGEALGHEDLLRLPADVLVPSSVPNVIHEGNAEEVKAKVVVEASEIPLTTEAEKVLHSNGVLVIPDILANAGGTISSYEEFSGRNRPGILKVIGNLISEKVRSFIEAAEKNKVTLREAAVNTALEKLKGKIEH